MAYICKCLGESLCMIGQCKCLYILLLRKSNLKWTVSFKNFLSQYTPIFHLIYNGKEIEDTLKKKI